MKDQITVVGNVAADPELRRLPDGAPVVSFRVASTDRRYDAKAGAWVDGATSWYRVSAFRALGEHVAASVRRGHRVIVQGGLTIRRWEAGDKSGTDAEIEANAVGAELAFGTTTYTRATKSRGDEASPAEAQAEWAPPQAEAAGVGAGEWGSPAAGTPF